MYLREVLIAHKTNTPVMVCAIGAGPLVDVALRSRVPGMTIAHGYDRTFIEGAALLHDAAEDILAYRHLPLEHQRQLPSTNPLDPASLKDAFLQDFLRTFLGILRAGRNP